MKKKKIVKKHVREKKTLYRTPIKPLKQNSTRKPETVKDQNDNEVSAIESTVIVEESITKKPKKNKQVQKQEPVETVKAESVENETDNN
jgi:hypothetical protein